MPAEIAVSVIVPVFNGADTLDRCLAALAAQHRRDFELIVVDNGSSDGSAVVAERWRQRMSVPLHVLHEAKPGAGAARNHGARRAGGRFLAFTDADCEPDADWLDIGLAMLAESERDVCALAGPAWGTLEGDVAARLLGLTSLSVGLTENIYRDAGDTGTQGFAAANLWMTREMFLDLQGFDESLAHTGEDMDLCARFYRAGGRLRYSPALRVRHIHPSGMANIWRKQVQYGRAHARLLRRYGESGIHLDLPWLGHLRIPCRCFIWCNLASAEKKVLLLLLLSCWLPWLLLLVPVYAYWTGRHLCQRAGALGVRCGVLEPLALGGLLVMKSAAMTWGRLRGSCRGVVTC